MAQRDSFAHPISIGAICGTTGLQLEILGLLGCWKKWDFKKLSWAPTCNFKNIIQVENWA